MKLLLVTVAILFCARATYGCAQGYVNCLVDPCQYASCPAFPNARCVSNYCGGCNAVFYLYGVALKPSQCKVRPVCNARLNEVYKTCAAPCDATCKKPKLPCSLQKRCTRRCACPVGHVRDANNVCIPLAKCPQTCDLSRNEVFRTCAPPCDATCANPQLPCSLQEICTRRCACPVGYVRDANKVCVPKDKCPQKCPGNQVYLPCVPCEHHCRDIGKICIALCTPGCGCRSGSHWNGKNCVRRDECPPKAVYNLSCPPGVPQVSCAKNPCDGATCRLNPTASCVENYCGGCNADFYIGHKKLTNHDCNIGCQTRPANCLVDPCQFAKCPARPEAKCFSNYCGGCTAEFWYNGVQLDPADCRVTPPVCNARLNEVYKTCAAPCDATCKNPKLPCSLQRRCTKRCACPAKHVRDANNVCIPLAKCPKKCPYGQESRCVSCVPTCPGPLDNGPQCKPIPGTPPCTYKCVCRYGRVLYTYGNKQYCIPRQYCPRLRG